MTARRIAEMPHGQVLLLQREIERRLRPEDAAGLLANPYLFDLMLTTIRSELALIREGSLSPVEESVCSTRRIKTTALVVALVHAGIHNFVKSPQGHRSLSKEDYAALWPDEVEVPEGVSPIFSNPLLVDQTIDPVFLRQCSRGFFYTHPADTRVPKNVPEFVCDTEGKRLRRAIVFWGYRPWIDRSAKDCLHEISPGKIPITFDLALWIATQYRYSRAIDILGAQTTNGSVPFMFRFGSEDRHSTFNAHILDQKSNCRGSGFRSSVVIPVE